MKKAFTLIEMMIAISIFALIITYLYQILDFSRKSNIIQEKNYLEFSKNERTKFLIYNDIFNQIDPRKDINITQTKDYDILKIRTNNSIHNLLMPYVAYMVENKTLFRLESISSIKLPIDYEFINNYKIDEIQKDVDLFKIYKNKNNLIFFLNSKEESKTFEIDLPFIPPDKIKKPLDDNETADDNKTSDINTTNDLNKTKE